MKEYKLVSELSHDTLEETVNKLMNDGWQPIGGISSYYIPNWPVIGENNTIFHQAMVR